MPTPCCTLLWGKSGKWHLLEYSICPVHTPPPLFLTILIRARSTVGAFWKNGSFSEHVIQKISDTCVDAKPRGIEATCIVVVTGDNLVFPVLATNAFTVASKWGYSYFFVYMFTNTINNKAKATNAFTIARRPSIQGAHMREKYLCKNLGVKEGEVICPKGTYFLELMVQILLMVHYIKISLYCTAIRMSGSLHWYNHYTACAYMCKTRLSNMN